MPTPSTPIIDDSASLDQVFTPPHTSCPPDDDRATWRSLGIGEPYTEAVVSTSEVLQQPTPPSDSNPNGQNGPQDTTTQSNVKPMDIDEGTSATQMMSPISVEGEKSVENELPAVSSVDMGSPAMGHDFSNVRLMPSSPSTFLRPGSKFVGTQQSERQVYEVQVEIKHVDMRESFLCGYLRIQGLTEDHPTLTTYFEGEIIGSKYTFLTQQNAWGSNDKVDLQHWAKFSAFRPFQKAAKRGNFHIPQLAQRENIFMRWKEQFLVPDHRVRTITGASFDGFYYICFNQIQGTVSGIYFHAKSENLDRFQQLELKHVEDRGCFSAMEFR
ncbi:hypothetical protein GLAREA_08841 [Glarea lozoyensis ATCC 20868]|uniref:Uncharacterized protein n=1 Tax=Glarea lozoyensis (strain ATCC 20868 / MF5171) TaxID=1116229 RepID=S3EEL1_GLAL2|nr:uncharacterized protein GLAREA_08841 [Glarea lozoyensis ATCC 20868]EPE36678.1 hypothetical protein GLAREA_08841 [Glarea lozoyensis ATCC 20868]